MSIDQSLLYGLSHLGGGSWKFDYAVFCLGNNGFLKGGLFMAAVWFFWFDPARREHRDSLVSMLLGTSMALALGKVIEAVAPFRQRPYQSHLAGMVFPYDMGMHHHESSFPSDHAILFFGLATGLYFVSRPTGLVAFLYALLVISVPRIYLGLHYPTDIAGGALLGAFCVLIMQAAPFRASVSRPILAFGERHPALFYAGFFMFTFLVSTLFDDLRALLAMVLTLVSPAGA